MVYYISYTLSEPGKKYDNLRKLIVGLSNDLWVHPLESTYIIKSDKTSREIYNFLSSVLDNNDKIFITEITKNYSGCLDKDTWTYIQNLF